MVMDLLSQEQVENIAVLKHATTSYTNVSDALLGVSQYQCAWGEGNIYEVVPGKLFFSVHRDDAYTVAKIGAMPNCFFFSGDFQERYLAFGADFGPVNLSLVHRFCEYVSGYMKDTRLALRPLVYYCDGQADICTNTAFLLASYLVLEHGYSAEMAVSPFTSIRNAPFLPFSDVTGNTSAQVSLLECISGMEKAIKTRWYEPDSFVVEEYEKLEDPAGGDIHFDFCPKLLALRNPALLADEADEGERFHGPSMTEFISALKGKGVHTVIRLGEPDSYSDELFTAQGMKHFDLDYSCGVPSMEVLKSFLDICDAEEGRIAVHCRTGIGCTGALIAAWMMQHSNMTARESIGWARIVRPGCVVGAQQLFLEELESQQRKRALS